MYINNDDRKAKIGKIQVDSRRGSLRIRFTYPKGDRKEFHVEEDTENNWLKALNIARKIDRDIEAGCFDNSLVSYSPNKAQEIQIVEKPLNIIEI
ncbi:MAG: DUF3596 domain-containing protein [Cyanobacteria bacterium J06621_8]